MKSGIITDNYRLFFLDYMGFSGKFRKSIYGTSRIRQSTTKYLEFSRKVLEQKSQYKIFFIYQQAVIPDPMNQNAQYHIQTTPHRVISID